MHDPKDGGGRIASGTAIEEQLPRRQSRGVRVMQDAYMDVGGRTALGASSRAITEELNHQPQRYELELITFTIN